MIAEMRHYCRKLDIKHAEVPTVSNLFYVLGKFSGFCDLDSFFQVFTAFFVVLH